MKPLKQKIAFIYVKWVKQTKVLFLLTKIESWDLVLTIINVREKEKFAIVPALEMESKLFISYVWGKRVELKNFLFCGKHGWNKMFLYLEIQIDINSTSNLRGISVMVSLEDINFIVQYSKGGFS